MVLLTVLEYSYEIENDIEEMREKDYSEEEILNCMRELKDALKYKIKELGGD